MSGPLNEPVYDLAAFCAREIKWWTIAADAMWRMATKYALHATANDWKWWAEYCDRRAEECRKLLAEIAQKAASAT